MTSNYKCIDKNFYFFAGILVFFSCQRFYFSEITANLSIIPLTLILLCRLQSNYQFYLLILSLILMIDKSEVAYTNTFAILKYCIYLAFLVSLLFKVINPLAFLLWAAWFTFIIFISIGNIEYISLNVFIRDLIFILSFIALVTRYSSLKDMEFEKLTDFIFYVSLAMLLSELINIMLFYNYFGGDYLSYSPMKILAVMASLIALIRKRVVIFLFLLIPTIFVLVNFQTRMIFVFYLICIVLITMHKASGWLKVGFFVSVAVFLIPSDLFAQFRVLNIFYYLLNGESFLSLLQELDPIRTAEHKIIANQNIFSLLFGNGIGVGYRDYLGLLDFVDISDSAFSEEELKNKLFFRLHDSWIYITHSFGLSVYLGLSYLCFREILGKSSEQNSRTISIVCLLLLNLSTYSAGGVMLLTLLLSVLVYKPVSSPSERLN
ncbi:hypothetical protein [Brumicola blandensis]|uniref:Uncharacterized protein n=1 Tax=Brumicola blandensis TaxID=3075611 RepID=A0AAW8QZU4_9ALTE|nr:hypothetical protein [Alteromonas sp. W409]MDT0582693.1 hypothetical protein [Alteromonas sp. W409]